MTFKHRKKSRPSTYSFSAFPPLGLSTNIPSPPKADYGRVSLCDLGSERACERTLSLGSSGAGGAKKSKSFDLDFFICVRRTQHHLTEGQHHYERSEYIISHSSGHKTMLCFAQMKLRQAANDVMLRINDVALRANTTLVFAP